MCGRAYQTFTEDELALRYLTERSKRRPIPPIKFNFNLAPTQISPIILVQDGDRRIGLFRWGIIPFWAKDVQSASKYSLINAKSEEITEKRSYKVPFQKQRCIVPVSGFFEWKKSGVSPKSPFAIQAKDHSILSMAGIWEHWKSKDSEEEVWSFSIITTSPNSVIKKIHDRMPVILEPSEEAQWLNPENQNVIALKKALKPCPDSLLEAYEVSTLVNSPKNNRKEILEPLD
ncbi:MAG: SOS response-associated peptidase [Bdellovibrionota bacterium]